MATRTLEKSPRRRRCLVALLLGLSGLPVPAKPQAGDPPKAAMATLPLQELLDLHQRLDTLKQQPRQRPPVLATLNSLSFSGRLFENMIDTEVRVDASVLTDEAWVELPLLTVDPATHVGELPTVENGHFHLRDNRLVFVTRSAGEYRFRLSLIIQAESKGPERQVDLLVPPATSVSMRIQFDPDLFQLSKGKTLPAADGVTILPEKNRFRLGWRLRKSDLAESQATERPPVESVIRTAHASVVSTLEGQRVTRILYQLELEGTKPISLRLPEGQKLRQVLLNGAEMSLPANGQLAELQVRPQRAGDAQARLELVIEEQPGRFSLSGRRTFAFPRLSWRVNRLLVRLHLPRVFNYAWAGGSLSPGQAETVTFSHRLPTPGTSHDFQQDLVTGSADVQIEYTVNLAGHFYNGNGH